MRTLGLVVIAALLLSGCTESASSDRQPVALPVDNGTPLASYDTKVATLERAPFCERIDAAATERILGGAPTSQTSYDNGDRAKLEGGKDVMNEYACEFKLDRVTAQAWLFAPPVTRARAKALVTELAATKGCLRLPDAAAYGAPSIALHCSKGEVIDVSYHGLFGDAWLTCALKIRTGPTIDIFIDPEDVGRWCVAVAQAAAVS